MGRGLTVAGPAPNTFRVVAVVIKVVVVVVVVMKAAAPAKG